MLVPISWLQDYVDITVSPKELEKKLFSAGFEVEELIELGRDISGVVVGLVEECEPIPDTHIHICKVNCGEKGTFQICCGADNVAVGGKYPVALIGATVLKTAKDHVTVEGVMTIKAGKLRGVESNGMLCSGTELGLNENLYPGAGYNGLLVLPEDAIPGSDIKPLVGLDEVIFDISLTANRPDCQSILGIAREVAAILGQPLKMPNTTFHPTDKTLDFDITVEAPELCPRYIGHYVSDIQIGEAPAWMRRRLALVGIRPISNMVDITNFVLKEIGQPMHAFDFSDLQDNRIVVRRARDGEKIVTLDEKTFSLKPENLVICDGERPVALAGIMGGLNSEIKDTTTDVLFEAAKFARDSIRKTSRALGQISDSSSRYEKGVDEYSTELGMARALALVEELGCGKVSAFEKRVAANPQAIEPHKITVSVSKINEILGITVPENVISSTLSALCFAPVIQGDALTLTVPPYREDIDDHEQDIAEEVIRSYGHEHLVPRFLNTAQVTAGGRTEEQKQRLKVKTVLAGQGFYESIFYSFFSPKDLDMIHLPENDSRRKAIRILNPISEDLSLMRTTMLPSMINAVVRNIRRGNTEGRLFELASVFLPESLPLTSYPEEREMLTMAAFGEKETFFTAKAGPEALAAAFDLRFDYTRTETTWSHPGMTAEISLDGKPIGVIGKLSYEIAEELSLDKPVFLVEIDYAALKDSLHKKMVYRPVSRFATEYRDLALVTDEEMDCETIRKTIAPGSGPVSSVELFDVYRGEQLGKGKKSMAFKLTFLPEDHELTSEEIDGHIKKILKKLEHVLGISLR